MIFFDYFVTKKNGSEFLHYPSSHDNYTCAESTIKISKQSVKPFLRYRGDQLEKRSFEKNAFKCSNTI